MNAQENKKPSLLNIIVIAALALLAIILVFFLVKNSNKVRDLQAEKEAQRLAFQYELDSLLTEHEAIKTEYGNLTELLAEKDSIIQVNAVEIKQLLDTQWEYVKVQRKLERLRVISQGYLHQMDSLYTLNRELQAENEQVKAKYEHERSLTKELQKDKETLIEKVEEAAILRAYNIKATPLNLKGVHNKESETDRARRTDLIRVCFSLAENNIAPSGMKDVYLRIARPDNIILVAGLGDDYSFVFNDNVLQYSAMRQVDYQNAELKVCADWINRNKAEPMQTGVYVVNIFHGDNEIGQTSFTLK
ncbi:MAG: hypothetical protein GX128_07360 [Bacteroidales bacterium]|jgi:vacuolar-type H+-ATPase subunit I/STV1|nr:hypothetical protein [Bacteroidales bacterium]